MPNINPSQATILIASDDVANATLVKKHLQDDFSSVSISAEPDKASSDFDQTNPEILLLAFNQLEKAERYQTSLYRDSTAVQQHPHYTIALYGTDDAKRVHALCSKHVFDEYVLFWTAEQDAPHLIQAIHQGVHQLVALRNGIPKANELAAPARRLGQLENLLESTINSGIEYMTAAKVSLDEARAKIHTDIDQFKQRLLQGKLVALPDSVPPNALDLELDRLKQGIVGERLGRALAAMESIDQWIEELRKISASRLEPTQTLSALTKRMPHQILVVDDDTFQNKIIHNILEPENYRILIADSGFAALNLLRKERPDLILMDYDMPEMDGIETIRRIKGNANLVNIPIVMLTGRSEKNTVTESIKAGVNGFLVKPYERDLLVAKIKQILGKAWVRT